MPGGGGPGPGSAGPGRPRSLTHATAPATSATTRTPAGGAGRRTTTTGSPRSRAARSFAAVAEPPLSLVTSTSMRCSRSSAVSPSTVYGPRSSRTRARRGSGGSGGSTARTRNRTSASSSPAKAARPCRPVVRNTPPSGPQRPGSDAAASAAEATECHRSPGPSVQPGRRRASSGTPVAAAACAAWRLMTAANGCVASTTASTPCPAIQRTIPAAPPNPPVRTVPTGSRGAATRPASEVVTYGRGRTPASAAASRRASAVPPRTSTCMGQDLLDWGDRVQVNVNMKSRVLEDSMTIGELADRFGLRPHTLRHWEATGLLAPASRLNGRRRYTQQHLSRVAMIVKGKAAGFSLEELRAVLDARTQGRRRDLLSGHLHQLEDRIHEMEASRVLVEHAMECPAEDFTQCPAFRRLVARM